MPIEVEPRHDCALDALAGTACELGESGGCEANAEYFIEQVNFFATFDRAMDVASGPCLTATNYTAPETGRPCETSAPDCYTHSLLT